MRRERCCQKADGCKAQSAAHVGHLGKLCNAADAVFWRNPQGRGAAGALLRCRTCEWEAPFAASSALHRIPPRRRRYRRLKPDRLLEEGWVPPLIALAAFNLDFLCIHPFRDGNGRVSRLLWLLQSYQLGYEVGRYISLERLVEQNKDRYYETLEKSSQGWHEGKHDPWPYINYVLFILKTAYKEFAERVGETKAPRGAKTDQVNAAIEQFAGEFSVAQLELRCPGVSRDMVRRVLREQQAAGKIECQGRGPAAKWRKKG
jgi:hypothetical protein